MYWTHIYCISTQLSQFCSFILMKQRTTVSTFTCLYRPSLMQSDWIWSWKGKRHRGYHCLSAQRGWGRPWWHPRTPQSLTRAGERVGKIKLPLRLLQTSMCLLSMRTTTCKTITQSKTNCLILSEFHFLPNLISYVYNYLHCFCGVVNWKAEGCWINLRSRHQQCVLQQASLLQGAPREFGSL